MGSATIHGFETAISAGLVPTPALAIAEAGALVAPPKRLTLADVEVAVRPVEALRARARASVAAVVTAASNLTAMAYRHFTQRRQLEAKTLAGLDAAHRVAATPLQRAVVGEVAGGLIEHIQESAIYRSDEAGALLERIAKDARPDDPVIVERHDRLRILSAALHGVESSRFRVSDERADALHSAVAALTAEEHADLAGELRTRLFNGTVPKKRMKYELAQELRQALHPRAPEPST